MQTDLTNILKVSNIGVWEYDIIKNNVISNDSFFKMLGYTREEYPKTSEGRFKMFHQDDVALVNEYMNKLINDEESQYSIEYRIKHKNGHWVWIHDIASVIRKSESGKPMIISGVYHDVSEKKKFEHQLKEKENQFRTLFDEAPFGYLALDENGCFIEANEECIEMLGYKKEELVGSYFKDYLIDNHKKYFEDQFNKFKQEGRLHLEFPILSKSKEEVHIRFSGQISYTTDNNFKQANCTIKDISEISLANKKLNESENKYQKLVGVIPIGLVLHRIILDDNGKPIDYIFLDGNGVYEQQIGKKMSDVIGKTVLEVFPETEKVWIEEYGKVALEGKTLVFEDYSQALDKYFKVTAFQTEFEHFAVIVDDITEERKKQNEIVYLSNHDFLSGLYNRRYFVKEYDRLDKEKQYPLCLMMIDINGLKIINDAFGHAVGDTVIQKFAEVCNQSFRRKDVIARIGGDEFAILLPKTTLEEVEEIKTKFKENLNEVVTENIHLSAAIGYEMKNLNLKESLDEILKIAENHMYSNKLAEGISSRNNAIKAILQTLTDKFEEERNHSNNVSMLCRVYGEVTNMNVDDIKELELAGLYHDIGKISLPDAILYKAGKLTNEEYTTIKTHPEVGYQILRAADEYSDLAIHALYHHERWDGKGYPKGLKEEEIPYYSRIICVADAYEAMTSIRPYKDKMSKNDAVKEIIKYSGTQFDPSIARIFVEKVLKTKWVD